MEPTAFDRVVHGAVEVERAAAARKLIRQFVRGIMTTEELATELAIVVEENPTP